MRYLFALLLAVSSCGVRPCYAADVVIQDASDKAAAKLNGGASATLWYSIQSSLGAISTGVQQVHTDLSGSATYTVGSKLTTTNALLSSTAYGLGAIENTLTRSVTGLPGIATATEATRIVLTSTGYGLAAMQDVFTNSVTGLGATARATEATRIGVAAINTALTSTASGLAAMEDTFTRSVTGLPGIAAATEASRIALLALGSKTILDPTRTWTGAALHGTIGPICSTVLTGAVYVQQKELTYTIQETGARGATVFVDVNNMDSCPPLTDASQWNCLTNPGIIVTQPVGGVSGQVGNNAYEVVKGYRWLKWRLEGVVKSNSTLYINWAVKINPAE